jgi:hypothetical protein
VLGKILNGRTFWNLSTVSGFAFEFVGAGFAPPGAWQHSAGRLFLNLPTFLNLLLNL